MQDFKKLLFWQKAHSFTVNLYKITNDFPSDEKFGLTNQIRRASVSIESNIAEGCGRSSDKDFVRFLYMAKGSVYEVECQIYIARDLSFLSEEKANLLIEKITEISKMLGAFIKKLEAGS